ncbi:MAG: hypothetical protein NXI32_14705 [bacterium]|nr:hypothetical protein [bacterium]
MHALAVLQLDAGTLAASESISQQVTTSEWLGPLAPIALSPFFGLASLSGIATYGPEWLQARSNLVGSTSPLNSPLLFWTMAGLALLTSLPRLTKVSKPLALAAENLETYSAIIILIAMRVLAASPSEASDADPAQAMSIQLSLVAGLTGIPQQLIGGLFSAINVFVINIVKLFFEFLIWLVPFPSIDALLEAANKSVCVALLSLYLYSPTLAMLLNLALLAVCLTVFGWCYRRLNFYRDLIAGPILAWLVPAWFAQRGQSITVYSEDAFGGLPAYTPFRLSRTSDGQFELRGRWLWKSIRSVLSQPPLPLAGSVLGQNLLLRNETGEFEFKHRHWTAKDVPLLPAQDAASQVAPASSLPS